MSVRSVLGVVAVAGVMSQPALVQPDQTKLVPTEADWAWLTEHRQKAFDALMPMPLDTGILVSFRSYRDLYHEVQEQYFTIDYSRDDDFKRTLLTAAVVVPEGPSIQQQLLDLRIRDRTASFDSLLSRVAVRKLTTDSNRCRAVREQTNRLMQLNLRIEQEDVVRLHPNIYRFVLNWSGGEMDVRLVDSRNALVRWAAATMNSLLACSPPNPEDAGPIPRWPDNPMAR